MARPPVYETPEEMQAIIDQYFDDCFQNRLSLNKGEPLDDSRVTDDEYPAVSGLAYAIGLTRQSLINYEHKDEFLDTVKSAKARIEAILEQRLYYPNATGVKPEKQLRMEGLAGLESSQPRWLYVPKP